MPTRVGIVSDTHGALHPGIAARLRGCEVIVHGGDVGNSAVLATLHSLCDELFAVHGNNDVPGKWPGADQKVLETLPARQQIPLPGGLLIVEHGHRVNPVTLRHDKLRQRHPQARAIVYGHSHRLVVDRATTPWVLNPGAGGMARTFGGASCLILRAEPGIWRVEPFRVSADP